MIYKEMITEDVIIVTLYIDDNDGFQIDSMCETFYIDMWVDLQQRIQFYHMNVFF